jgi:hypothetical protein
MPLGVFPMTQRKKLLSYPHLGGLLYLRETLLISLFRKLEAATRRVLSSPFSGRESLPAENRERQTKETG